MQHLILLFKFILPYLKPFLYRLLSAKLIDMLQTNKNSKSLSLYMPLILFTSWSNIKYMKFKCILNYNWINNLRLGGSSFTNMKRYLVYDLVCNSYNVYVSQNSSVIILCQIRISCIYFCACYTSWYLNLNFIHCSSINWDQFRNFTISLSFFRSVFVTV